MSSCLCLSPDMQGTAPVTGAQLPFCSGAIPITTTLASVSVCSNRNRMTCCEPLSTPVIAAQEVARREAQEINRLERAAMSGMLVPAEAGSREGAAGPRAESAAASMPRLAAAPEPGGDPASAFARAHPTAAEEQSAAAAEPPAESGAVEMAATASAAEPASDLPLLGRLDGVPSVPCYHAYIHAHAAAGDLRSDSGGNQH